MKYYCLFHNSGFRTYRINGEPSEPLTQMVTAENRYDYPTDGGIYMNMSTSSVIFQYIDQNTLTLVVNDIPSIRKDTGGNPIKCAFQIIADKDEEKDLQKIAYKISSDSDFNVFYANLFKLRGGLKIEGKELFDYLQEAGTISIDENLLPSPKKLSVEVPNELQDICNYDNNSSAKECEGDEPRGPLLSLFERAKKKLSRDTQICIVLLITMLMILAMLKTCQSKESSMQSMQENTKSMSCISCKTVFERDSELILAICNV